MAKPVHEIAFCRRQGDMVRLSVNAGAFWVEPVLNRGQAAQLGRQLLCAAGEDGGESWSPQMTDRGRSVR